MFWMATEDSTGAAAVRTALLAFYTSVYANMWAGTTAKLEPELAIVDPITGKQTGIVVASTFSVTGSLATDPIPFANCALVRWRTGQFTDGRENRGRTFLTGPVEASSLGGYPDPAWVAAVETAANTLVAASSAALGVWSRKHQHIEGVQSASVWNKWAILRSRRD